MAMETLQNEVNLGTEENTCCWSSASETKNRDDEDKGWGNGGERSAPDQDGPGWHAVSPNSEPRKNGTPAQCFPGLGEAVESSLGDARGATSGSHGAQGAPVAVETALPSASPPTVKLFLTFKDQEVIVCRQLDERWLPHFGLLACLRKDLPEAGESPGAAIPLAIEASVFDKILEYCAVVQSEEPEKAAADGKGGAPPGPASGHGSGGQPNEQGVNTGAENSARFAHQTGLGGFVPKVPVASWPPTQEQIKEQERKHRSERRRNPDRPEDWPPLEKFPVSACAERFFGGMTFAAFLGFLNDVNYLQFEYCLSEAVNHLRNHMICRNPDELRELFGVSEPKTEDEVKEQQDAYDYLADLLRKSLERVRP